MNNRFKNYRYLVMLQLVVFTMGFGSLSLADQHETSDQQDLTETHNQNEAHKESDDRGSYEKKTLKYCELIKFFHYKNLCYKMVQEEGVPEYALARSILFIEENENKYVTVDHKERTQTNTGMVKKQVLVRGQFVAIVDFNKPSNQKRLHIINTGTWEHVRSYVTHGRGTGGLKAEGKNSFSNVPDSNKSAVGLYLTGSTYLGSNGRSLNLYGMDTTNSNAAMRDVVMHKADYATEAYIKAHGMLGRSLGCPAVPPEIMKDEVLVKLGEGAILYLHYDGIEPVKLEN